MSNEGDQANHSRSNREESEAFVKACQDRGCEIVPSDDIVAWLQSLPRTKRGDSFVILNAPALALQLNSGTIRYFKRHLT